MLPSLPNSLKGPSNREHELPPAAPPARAFALAAAAAPLPAAAALAAAWWLRPSGSGLPGQLAPPPPVSPVPEAAFGTFFWLLAALTLTLAGPLCLLCGLARPERAKALLNALIINMLWVVCFVLLALPLTR